MSRVADKMPMIARRKPQVVVILRSQGLQQSERGILSQPFGHEVVRAVYCVGLLAKGITIRCVALLVSHPAQPHARPCGT